MRCHSRLRAATVALLAGVLLAACGTAGDSGSSGSEARQQSPVEALTLASAKTTQAKTAKLAFTVATSGTGAQAGTVNGEGVADFDAHKVQMTMNAGSERVEMVMDGTTIYLQVPGQQLEPGKSWLKLDLKAMGTAAGKDLANLASGAGNDPTQALALLQGASTDVREVGTERVRGTETTHYKATIDLRKAAEQQGPEARKQLDRLLQQAEVQSLPADVWVDDQGRLRKMQYALKMMAKASDQGQGSATVNTTVELFDFGTTAKVEPPPAGQVADFAEVLQQGKDGSSG
jgi:endonuclease YncB( thermonuclease family)